jgi:nicotinamide-nucleotide amidase
MFDTYVFPRLREIAGDVHVARRLIRIAGMGESAVDEIAAPIYSKVDGVDTSILFNRTEVEIHLAARDDSDEAASAIADKLVADLSSAFGIAAFSTDGETMEEVVGRLLRERGESLSVAESCTGGLIGRRLTEVPGSSGYFMEGVITYSNDAKMRVLGVTAETLEKHGAVSAECAEEMAAGMREAAGTSHVISVTGVAGPGGGSEEKPVGTVFIGYAGDGVVRSIKVVLPGDRYLIRWRASQSALDYLRRQLLTAG